MQRCGACAYFVSRSDVGGACRRHQPEWARTFGLSIERGAGFPKVHPRQDWCGQWTAKKQSGGQGVDNAVRVL